MTQLAVVIIVVLLPGIIAATVTDKLTVHSKWDSFKFALYSLVLGTLTYSLLQIIVYAVDFLKYLRSSELTWTPLVIWQVAEDGTAPVSPWEIVSAVFLSLPFAFLISACVQHKWITRVGRSLRVTSKYGDENLYSYFMNARETVWVYVRDKEQNLTYEGRVFSFSENEHVHEVVLSDVRVYRYEDSALLYSVPTAYISRPTGRLVIESIPEDCPPERNDDD